VAELAFWRLSGGDPAGEAKTYVTTADGLAVLAADAIEGLRRLIAAYDDPTTPYLAQPRPDKAPRYTDYDHLARIDEWSGGGLE
jgi:ATP-dependent helicase/nuclease subunit B